MTDSLTKALTIPRDLTMFIHKKTVYNSLLNFNASAGNERKLTYIEILEKMQRAHAQYIKENLELSRRLRMTDITIKIIGPNMTTKIILEKDCSSKIQKHNNESNNNNNYPSTNVYNSIALPKEEDYDFLVTPPQFADASECFSHGKSEIDSVLKPLFEVNKFPEDDNLKPFVFYHSFDAARDEGEEEEEEEEDFDIYDYQFANKDNDPEVESRNKKAAASLFFPYITSMKIPLPISCKRGYRQTMQTFYGSISRNTAYSHFDNLGDSDLFKMKAQTTMKEVKKERAVNPKYRDRSDIMERALALIGPDPDIRKLEIYEIPNCKKCGLVVFAFGLCIKHHHETSSSDADGAAEEKEKEYKGPASMFSKESYLKWNEKNTPADFKLEKCPEFLFK